MTPRGPPTGRMCLTGGIGGVSPRHTLASPALAGQGRQVSIRISGDIFTCITGLVASCRETEQLYGVKN